MHIYDEIVDAVYDDNVVCIVPTTHEDGSAGDLGVILFPLPDYARAVAESTDPNLRLSFQAGMIKQATVIASQKMPNNHMVNLEEFYEDED